MTDRNAATRADLLVAVERSPTAARAHDRAGWVALFGQAGQVEDPVGSRPHRGADEITHFYDTFIGPRDITFHRDVDFVVGSTVLRDLELEVTMASTLTMRIPAYLRYDLDEELRITRLQALWELPAMVRQFASSGAVAVPAGIRLARSLIRNQGLRGSAGFLAGFRGVGGRGRNRLADLLDDACAGNDAAVERQLSPEVMITRGEQERLVATDLVARLSGGRPDKILTAGHTVAARIDFSDRRSVVIVEMRPGSLAVTRVRLFDQTNFGSVGKRDSRT